MFFSCNKIHFLYYFEIPHRLFPHYSKLAEVFVSLTIFLDWLYSIADFFGNKGNYCFDTGVWRFCKEIEYFKPPSSMKLDIFPPNCFSDDENSEPKGQPKTTFKTCLAPGYGLLKAFHERWNTPVQILQIFYRTFN